MEIHVEREMGRRYESNEWIYFLLEILEPHRRADEIRDEIKEILFNTTESEFLEEKDLYLVSMHLYMDKVGYIYLSEKYEDEQVSYINKIYEKNEKKMDELFFEIENLSITNEFSCELRILEETYGECSESDCVESSSEEISTFQCDCFEDILFFLSESYLSLSFWSSSSPKITKQISDYLFSECDFIFETGENKRKTAHFNDVSRDLTEEEISIITSHLKIEV